MRKVTIVVPVLITSCQVSLNPNIGPSMAQMMMLAAARRKVTGRADARAVPFVSRVNHDVDLVGLIMGGCYSRNPKTQVPKPKSQLRSEPPRQGPSRI